MPLKNSQKEIDDLKKTLNEEKKISMLTKEYLFYLESQINKNNTEIKNLKKNNKKLVNEINIMKSTLSWKITKPLRVVNKFFHKK